MSSNRSTEELSLTLCQFIDSSPTPYHATAQMVSQLVAGGFSQLNEKDAWDLQPQSGYVVTRNDSSVIAFTTGADVSEGIASEGMALVGAHTDSPCLKVKPNPDISKQGVSQLGVEVYGGVLLNPWFDRDLSLAGRITYEIDSGASSGVNRGVLQNALIDFKKPIARIPSLAIHLDREANSSRTINAQKHLPLVLGATAKLGTTSKTTTQVFNETLKKQLEDQLGQKAGKIFAYEIYAYDTQASGVTGLNGDYISAAAAALI